MRFVKLLAIVLVSGALVLADIPEAPAAYPDKPITVIVPFGAGGAYGRLGRKMGADLEKKLGVPVVVKNNPGAGGRKGAVVLFKSKPDGYTIGFVHFVSFQSNEILRGKKASIDYNKFKIILKLTDAKQFVFVNKKSPIKSLADFKKAGRPIKFATTGVGAVTWVEANALGATLGFPVKFVTGYRTSPRRPWRLRGATPRRAPGGTVHVRNVLDDLRLLAFIADKKDPNLPDVPTTTELGLPQLSVLGVRASWPRRRGRPTTSCRSSARRCRRSWTTRVQGVGPEGGVLPQSRRSRRDLEGAPGQRQDHGRAQASPEEEVARA